ncbi:type II toxin-antitoxin system VapC family toxin [Amycolatopsis alkalitolerans]|uniref:Ribonuclease VapC n=1 Tax=Amycolatopsis alkalitolerans TaxID=2547244 RepID=A0A5C4M6S8_9PSEU|nr:type II toxin-antitoxin system VapC family toxin [Amycolatopsis alkalitolerans]TNC28563.1 type II toxin-antitoxin system VapC family toxin [Amycolatopsis alkalitolerans]
MIVIDASLMVEALVNDSVLGDLAQSALNADPRWVAPEHLRVEATSAIRGLLLAKKLSGERADTAVSTLNQLTVGYAGWGEIADRVWELRHNLTPYDAAYIALAEIRGCRLVTTDRKLLDCSARSCQVDVVGDPAPAPRVGT